MSLNDIVTALTSAVGVLIVLGLSFINVPKINLNLWGIIGKNLTKDLTGKLDTLEERVDNIDQKLVQHIEEDTESRIRTARVRILRFGSDILNGTKPTKEHEEDTIDDITIYEDYCRTHPGFKNNKAEITIKLIKKDYEERLLSNDFS